MRLPILADVRAAAVRIEGVTVKTPLLRCEELDEITGARVAVKAESLQRFGAFKLRGAYNKIASLSHAERSNGVLAYSSGNHAAAVAGAARMFGVPAVIVMPADAPRVKIDNTRALGGEIHFYDRAANDRETIGARLAAERGLALIKPFDDAEIIAGQGTIGLEIAAEIAPDVVLAPASGGGLVNGVALALPGARVFAVEPAGHEDIVRSLAAGSLQPNAPGVRSICDALLAPSMSPLTFALAQANLAGALAADDAAALRAMRFAFQHLKLVLEPGGALALAALLDQAIDVRGQSVAVVASGGNVDAALFARALA